MAGWISGTAYQLPWFRWVTCPSLPLICLASHSLSFTQNCTVLALRDLSAAQPLIATEESLSCFYSTCWGTGQGLESQHLFLSSPFMHPQLPFQAAWCVLVENSLISITALQQVGPPCYAAQKSALSRVCGHIKLAYTLLIICWHSSTADMIQHRQGARLCCLPFFAFAFCLYLIT